MASVNGHSSVVKLLLSDPRVDPAASICNAIQFGRLEVVAALLADPRVDPNTDVLNEAICLASENGYTDVVRFLQRFNSTVVNKSLI